MYALWKYGVFRDTLGKKGGCSTPRKSIQRIKTELMLICVMVFFFFYTLQTTEENREVIDTVTVI